MKVTFENEISTAKISLDRINTMQYSCVKCYLSLKEEITWLKEMLSFN